MALFSSADRGRYTADSGGVRFETRIDPGPGGFVVSGDVLRAGGGAVSGVSFFTPYVMQGATDPRLAPDTDPPWDVDVVAVDGARSSGTLDLVRSGAGSWRQTLVLLDAVGGFRAGEVLSAGLVQRGRELRELTVEVRREDGVNVPGCVVFGGVSQPVGRESDDTTPDVTRCLAAAGISVVGTTTEPASIPKQLWDASTVYDALRDLVGEAPGEAPGWRVQVLLLSAASDPGLLGLSVDGPRLPRQAAAVFVDSIRALDADRGGGLFERRMAHALLHEQGHCLNLQHPFDRRIGQSRSHSHMNYEWKFPHRDADPYAFWGGYTFTYSEDEVRFLRHATYGEVTPGESQFGTAAYWPPPPARAAGPYAGLTLWLTGPGAQDQPEEHVVLTADQPITFTVSLRNDGDGPVPVPRRVLDVKTQLEVEVVNLDAPAGSGNAAVTFRPNVLRCQVAGPGESLVLDPGDSVHENLRLTAGSGGTFPGAGRYRVTPFLTFPAQADDADGFDDVIEGQGLDVVMSAADDTIPADEVDALTRDPEVSMFFALGGARTLGAAKSRLVAARERRGPDPEDPVVAAIARTLGIEAARQGDLRGAVDEFTAATAGATTFDPVTREQTLRLLADRRAEHSEHRDAPAPAVVVDLQLRRPDGSVSGGKVLGFPEGRELPGGRIEMVRVLVPADHLGAGALVPAQQPWPQDDGSVPTTLTEGCTLAADIVVRAADGLIERVGAHRMRLVGDGAGDPLLALIQLTRPVVVDADGPRPAASDHGGAETADFDSLGTRSFGQHEAATLRGERLDDWTSGADGAHADLGRRAMVAGGPIPGRLRPSRLQTDAFLITDDQKPWYCKVLKICDHGDPFPWPDPDHWPDPWPWSWPWPWPLGNPAPHPVLPRLQLQDLQDVPDRWVYEPVDSRGSSTQEGAPDLPQGPSGQPVSKELPPSPPGKSAA